MADRGIIPKVMGTRSKHNTPSYGILISASGVILLGWLSFSQVIDLLNLLYCFAQVIEFAAFLKLRMKYPNMERPYQIPLSTAGIAVMLLFPMAFAITMICISSTEALWIATITFLLGIALYFLLQVMRSRQWCKFENKFDGVYDATGTFNSEVMELVENLSIPSPTETVVYSEGIETKALKKRDIFHHNTGYGSVATEDN